MEKLLPRHSVSYLLILLPLVSVSLNAADGGRVNMQGAVVETACAIDTKSRDQTIEMFILPLNQLIRDGHGLKHEFTIRLINCALERKNKNTLGWQRFQVTFDGRVDNGLFAVEGQAQGVALELKDNNGNIAYPGKPLPPVSMIEGKNLLNYSLRLMSNSRQLRAGEYASAIRFKMDYY